MNKWLNEFSVRTIRITGVVVMCCLLFLITYQWYADHQSSQNRLDYIKQQHVHTIRTIKQKMMPLQAAIKKPELQITRSWQTDIATLATKYKITITKNVSEEQNTKHTSHIIEARGKLLHFLQLSNRLIQQHPHVEIASLDIRKTSNQLLTYSVEFIEQSAR